MLHVCIHKCAHIHTLHTNTHILVTTGIFNVSGTILISQWMQSPHTVDGDSVTNQINEIAQAVGSYILQMRGIKDSQNILSTVKELSLPSSAVLQSINEVLYNQMKFTGNSDDYYNPNNSYIDKVTVMLCVV